MTHNTHYANIQTMRRADARAQPLKRCFTASGSPAKGVWGSVRGARRAQGRSSRIFRTSPLHLGHQPWASPSLGRPQPRLLANLGLACAQGAQPRRVEYRRNDLSQGYIPSERLVATSSFVYGRHKADLHLQEKYQFETCSGGSTERSKDGDGVR